MATQFPVRTVRMAMSNGLYTEKTYTLDSQETAEAFDATFAGLGNVEVIDKGFVNAHSFDEVTAAIQAEFKAWDAPND